MSVWCKTNAPGVLKESFMTISVVL